MAGSLQMLCKLNTLRCLTFEDTARAARAELSPLQEEGWTRIRLVRMRRGSAIYLEWLDIAACSLQMAKAFRKHAMTSCIAYRTPFRSSRVDYLTDGTTQTVVHARSGSREEGAT